MLEVILLELFELFQSMKMNKTMTWEDAIKWLKEQPSQQELVKQCYYDDPLESAAERFSSSDEWLAVKDLLSGFIPGKVLDLGAGRGISSYAFAKMGCEVIALEPDHSSVAGAAAIKSLVETTRLPISVVTEYGETLPFADNSFDIVYGRAVLHHARDLAKFCSESARVLRKGGLFIATREHVISRRQDLQSFLNSHPLHRLYGGENAYLLKEYMQAIKAAGLDINKVVGPLASAVNFAPMTCQEFKLMLTSLLAERVGSKVAELLGSNRLVQELLGNYLSWKSDNPGRLFSFKAVKI